MVIYKEDSLIDAEKAAKALRKEGIKTDVYLDEGKMKKVYDYTEKNRIPYLLTVSPSLSLKNLATREIKELDNIEEVIKKLKA